MLNRGAKSIINRVDADVNFEQFFDIWLTVVQKILAGDFEAGHNLSLRVTAYGENNAFSASMSERKRLSHSFPAAWHFRLNIENSNINYRAGDTLYILPQNDDQLLNDLALWLNQPHAVEVLKNRELRLISKNVLRELAKLSASQKLKEMLQIKNRKILEQYLYGTDLLDILQDFCSKETVKLENLESMLPICQPRAYSIASSAHTDYIDLCVREVDYQHNGRDHHGTATHWLLNHQGTFQIFSRANTGFYLRNNLLEPVILIGTGTGIAPLIGLLREMADKGEQRQVVFIFGEKRSSDDFLYRDDLEKFVNEGVLNQLITAFSRDGGSKYYVQHAIEENAEFIGKLLTQGAHVYLCGNRQYLENSIASVFNEIDYDNDDGHSVWQHLIEKKRLHLELY